MVCAEPAGCGRRCGLSVCAVTLQGVLALLTSCLGVGNVAPCPLLSSTLTCLLAWSADEVEGGEGLQAEEFLSCVAALGRASAALSLPLLASQLQACLGALQRSMQSGRACGKRHGCNNRLCLCASAGHVAQDSACTVLPAATRMQQPLLFSGTATICCLHSDKLQWSHHKVGGSKGHVTRTSNVCMLCGSPSSQRICCPCRHRPFRAFGAAMLARHHGRPCAGR